MIAYDIVDELLNWQGGIYYVQTQKMDVRYFSNDYETHEGYPDYYYNSIPVNPGILAELGDRIFF